MVYLNSLPVLAAALAVFVPGCLWYSPLLFFKPWMRLRGLDPVAEQCVNLGVAIFAPIRAERM